MSVINDLKNRVVEYILIACIDGLAGFQEAIAAVYPKAEIQRCIIHQIRNNTKFVSYKDLKALMVDLKSVYPAVTEGAALQNLEVFDECWGKKYPRIVISWRENWQSFQYISSILRPSER